MDRKLEDHNRNVVEYYHATYAHYRDGWMDRSNLAMHFGFTDEKARSHGESLIRMNEVLAERIGIRGGEWILDAGCGVGGSGIWIAKNLGARVTGISLVERQVRQAIDFVREDGLSRLVDFCVADFMRTGFSAGCFDVLWAIESSCYALQKHDFGCEAWRVLKPGGRMVIADFFLGSGTPSEENEAILNAWLSAWAMPPLLDPGSFIASLEAAGFENVCYENITRHVVYASVGLYLAAERSLTEAIDCQSGDPNSAWQVANILGCRDQYLALTQDMWEYGILWANKPI